MAKRSTQGATSVDIVPELQGTVAHGRIVCSAGPLGRVWLSRFALELCDTLSGKARVRNVLFAHLPDNCQPVRAHGNSDFSGPMFWDRVETIVDFELESRRPHNEIVLVTEKSGPIQDTVANEIAQECEDRFEATTEFVKEVTLENPYPQTVSVSSYRIAPLAKEPKRIAPKASRTETDVGILTIVTEEAAAVVRHLEKVSQNGFRKRRGRNTVRTFYEGVFEAAAGNHHRVVCTQSIKQGNRPIVSAYRDLAEEYSPRLIVLLGVAGAIHKDIDLCDVVFVDHSFYYEQRKETEQGPKRRGEGYEVAAWLRPLLNEMFVSKGSEPFSVTAAEGSANPKFNIFKGPLGAGEAVVAYRDSEIRKWLETVNDKTLVLETEEGGVREAFYEQQLSHGYKADGYLVIRAVSDHADRDKGHRWHSPASHNAVRALAGFLSTISSLSDVIPSK